MRILVHVEAKIRGNGFYLLSVSSFHPRLFDLIFSQVDTPPFKNTMKILRETFIRNGIAVQKGYILDFDGLCRKGTCRAYLFQK